MKHFIHYSFNKTFNIGCINLDWGNSDIWSKEMLKKILNIHQGWVFWAHVYFNIVVLADAFALSTWFSKRKEKQDLNHNARLLKYVVLLNCSAILLQCYGAELIRSCSVVVVFDCLIRCISASESMRFHTYIQTEPLVEVPADLKTLKTLNEWM